MHFYDVLTEYEHIHVFFFSRLFNICSWGVREEALDAHPPEQWAGGTGDAVSLQPAGPTDQSSGPSGETLPLMLRSMNTEHSLCVFVSFKYLIWISSFRSSSNRTQVLKSLRVFKNKVSLGLKYFFFLEIKIGNCYLMYV